MYELALFAGAGGGILGGMLCSHTCIGAVEIGTKQREILLQRQRDGILPAFPVWDDVCTFSIETAECRQTIEEYIRARLQLIITGGFPCQDISICGPGVGIEGERSGLWKQFCRIVREILPIGVLLENSPMLLGRGLAVVLGDLAEMGYDARWCCLGADAIGACHKRERFWLLATHADSFSNSPQIEITLPRRQIAPSRQFARAIGKTSSADEHARLLRNPYGLAREMDRLEAVGNGQVPGVVVTAMDILTV